MSNTAVATVTLPTGEIVTSDMTPEARFAVVAKANLTTQAHTPETQQRFETGEKVDAALALQKARNITEVLTPKAAPVVKAPKLGTPQYVEVYQAKLNDVFRNTPAEQRTEAWYQRWHEEKNDAASGRRMGEERGKYLNRLAGIEDDEPTPPVKAAPASTEAPVGEGTPQERAEREALLNANQDAALDKATKASNQYGYAPASAITGPLTYGYQIPPGEWHVAELVAGLRLARLGDVSQAQLNAMLARGNV